MDVDRRADRRLAWGGIVGPTAFVLAWSLNGSVASDYAPVDDAISELARLGAPTRFGMTIGFVAFAVGVAAYARLLRAILPGPAWLTLLLSAVATLGVALFPLGGPVLDVVHGACAATGYLTLAATPLLAAGPLARAGRPAWARLSVAVGVVSATALLATLTGEHLGLFQRAGLGVVDLWIVATAVEVLRTGSLAGEGVAPPSAEGSPPGVP